MERLSTIAPDVANDLRGRSSSELRAAAFAVVGWALAQTQMSDPRIDDAIAALRRGEVGDSAPRSGLADLVGELDEVAWDLLEDDSGRDHYSDEYLQAFARARTANALWCALEVNPRGGA